MVQYVQKCQTAILNSEFSYFNVEPFTDTGVKLQSTAKMTFYLRAK